MIFRQPERPVVSDIAQIVILHTQMNGSYLECLRQRQNFGILSHILLHGVGQSLLKGRTGLQSHTPCNARLLSAYNVDGRGVHLRNMAAAHHGEAVEGMECIGKPVLADVFLVGRKVFAVAVHVRKGVHVIVLEHFVQFPQIRPALVVEVAVADGRADDHAVVLHDPLVADDLGGQGLHHLDGVGAHAVAVVEVGGHAEDDDVVLLLRPVDVGALVRRLPGHGLHLPGPAGVNLDLAALGVQHGVAAEEFLAHLLLHVHALLVELVPHLAVRGHGHEVLPVHHLGHVVGRDAPPVGDAGGAVLVAAGVAAVGVALGVPDEHRHVRVVDVLVHDHVVPLGGVAQVHQVVIVLAVVAGDLAGGVELAEQLGAQDGLHLGHGGPGVQAVGEQQQHVLLLHPGGVQLVQAGTDGHLPVAGRLVAPLDDVRNHDNHRAPLVRQLPQGGHADGVADGLQGGGVQAVPVLGQTGRIGHGLPGDEDVRAVGQLRAQQALPILKFQFHKITSSNLRKFALRKVKFIPNTFYDYIILLNCTKILTHHIINFNNITQTLAPIFKQSIVFCANFIDLIQYRVVYLLHIAHNVKNFTNIFPLGTRVHKIS